MANKIFVAGVATMAVAPLVWHYAGVTPDGMLGASTLIGGILGIGGWIAWTVSLKRIPPWSER